MLANEGKRQQTLKAVSPMFDGGAFFSGGLEMEVSICPYHSRMVKVNCTRLLHRYIVSGGYGFLDSAPCLKGGLRTGSENRIN